MSEKREWVLKAFRGEVVDRVPVGFWHHFTSEEEWLKGFSNPVIIEKNIQGHKRFIRDLHPDFIKLMSDGYFAYPIQLLPKESHSKSWQRFNLWVKIIRGLESR